MYLKESLNEFLADVLKKRSENNYEFFPWGPAFPIQLEVPSEVDVKKIENAIHRFFWALVLMFAVGAFLDLFTSAVVFAVYLLVYVTWVSAVVRKFRKQKTP